MSAFVIDLERFELRFGVFVAGQNPNLLFGFLKRLLTSASQLDAFGKQPEGFFQGDVSLLQLLDDLFQFFKLRLKARFTSGHPA